MNRQTSLADALTSIDVQIEDLQEKREALRWLIARGPDAPTIASEAAPRRRQGPGIAALCAEVLKEAGRPMNAMTEIVPVLEGRGIAVNKLGLHTALVRYKDVRRTERGVYVYAPQGGGRAG